MHLGDGLTLAAVTTWLPPGREHAEAMVASGRVRPDQLADLGVTSVPAGDVSGPELAARAARRALDRAGLDPARVGLLVHAWIHHQGHDLWSPAHYVARRAGTPNALPIGLQQLCNGGAAALGTAAAHLLADPALDTALVTTGDVFALPDFDRWSADYAVVFGDGGTAALLRRGPARPGDLVLRSLAQAAAPEFEAMYRGDDAWSPAPRWHSAQIDARRTKKAYLRAAGGIDAFNAAGADIIRHTVGQALAEAGLTAADPRIRVAALPRLGDSSLDASYRAVLEGWIDADLLVPREGSGHLGAGDTVANLAHIRDEGLLGPGEFALVMLSGGGFTWSCAVVQAA